MKTDVSLLAQPKPMPFSRKMIIEFLYLVWMGALPLISSSVLGYYAISNPDFFQSLEGIDLLVFWCLAIFIMGLAFSPTTFFALFTGYIWGLNGIIPLIVAYSIASLLGFFVAKLLKGEAILSFIKSKFKTASFLDHVQSNSFSWVFLARLSPVFPFAITNAIMAFLGVSAQKFFIAGTLGMLPRTLLAVWTGMQAKSIENLWNNPTIAHWQDFLSLALLVFSGAGMFYLAKKHAH
ncbi:MAG: TVP38/TMEM64 family protein [Cytophagales bacterium]|nr:TVP38/TMEM64 family protein [Cytophagales bacterium]